MRRHRRIREELLCGPLQDRLSKADGSISDYYPDFIVKVSPKEYYVVETKGREDLDDVEKIKRLKQWCEDVNANQRNSKFKMLYIKQRMGCASRKAK